MVQSAHNHAVRALAWYARLNFGYSGEKFFPKDRLLVHQKTSLVIT